MAHGTVCCATRSSRIDIAGIAFRGNRYDGIVCAGARGEVLVDKLRSNPCITVHDKGLRQEITRGMT